MTELHDGNTSNGDGQGRRFSYCERPSTSPQEEEESQQDSQQSKANRFTFYDPEEIRAAERNGDEEIRGSVEASKEKPTLPDPIEAGDKDSRQTRSGEGAGDLAAILRSLEQTERERALRPAIEQSSDSTYPDRILKSRSEDESLDLLRESERNARQERIAKYASRLVEQQRGAGVVIKSDLICDSPFNKAVHTREIRELMARSSISSAEWPQLLPHPPAHYKDPARFDEIEGATDCPLDIDIETAISGDGPDTANSSNATSSSATAPYINGVNGDSLDATNSRASEYVGQRRPGSGDESLNVELDPGIEYDVGDIATGGKDSGSGSSRHSFQNSSGSLDEDLDDYGDEEGDRTVSTLNNVLGPLSGPGGRTGIVLSDDGSSSECDSDSPASESSDEVSSESTRDTETSYDSQPSESKKPQLFLESLSAAVSYVTSAISVEEQSRTEIMDKYSAHEDDTDGVFYDKEAHELMRSLCAHLLPCAEDSFADASGASIPYWNEDDPGETGYRVVRLTKAQLSMVEREFQLMIGVLKRRSERELIESDWSEGDAGLRDSGFLRDLAEAESILGKEEKVEFVNTSSRGRSESESSGSDGESGELKQLVSIGPRDTNSAIVNRPISVDEPPLPDFPDVKGSGQGRLGDFETFSLPIIYKSRVTGFEPTKDIHLEPGNIVAGQYLVESELGSAAFSTAYRCIDLSSDPKGDGNYRDEVCLKVIKNTKDFFDQSLDEIKILERLRRTGKCQERNVLEMKTFFYHREHLFIVTELLRQNLFEFGKFIVDNDEEPYFTERRLCYITRQVLVALDFVHSMGLVHSDVKPENILLSSYSRATVVLIDFGSSCYLTDRQSSYIQSRSYRAPEVILGLPYDGRIDIWSLGAVVMELFTGEVAFQNDSIVSMLARIEAICGPFPRHMITAGRQSSRYFSAASGLLYEGLDEDTIDIFQPKRTTVAQRLGFEDKISHEEELLADFCRNLLTVDPQARPTAADALSHPWIISGESLTEVDVKYPTS